MSRFLKLALSRRNIEVFHLDSNEARRLTLECKGHDTRIPYHDQRIHRGWYWWSCSPGCIPDSDMASGPFTSATAAAEDALEGLS
jgi:hypothetical protein